MLIGQATGARRGSTLPFAISEMWRENKPRIRREAEWRVKAALVSVQVLEQQRVGRRFISVQNKLHSRPPSLRPLKVKGWRDGQE